MNRIYTIWKKELRDTIRDRRTLMSSIILPLVLMPGMILGIGNLAKYQEGVAAKKTVVIAIVNPDEAPAFVAQLKAAEKVGIQKAPADPTKAVREKKLDLAIVLPQTTGPNVGTTLMIYHNSLNERSTLALAKVATTVAQYNQFILTQRLQTAGVDVGILRGWDVEQKETATAEEIGGFGLGFLLPLFIIMWAMVGGQYTAIDVSAGEKERKTLEALLMTPVRRIDIVLGKFCAVSTTAFASVLIALGSLSTVFAIGGSSLISSGTLNTGSAGAQTGLSLVFSLHPQAIGILIGMSVLLVMLFSALNLSIAIFAKSYKEAQSYIGPSYLIVILPVIVMNIIPGFVPSTPFYLIPIMNAIFLFKEVLVGTYNVAHILLTGTVLAVAALLVILLATRIYQKEGVLFKE